MQIKASVYDSITSKQNKEIHKPKPKENELRFYIFHYKIVPSTTILNPLIYKQAVQHSQGELSTEKLNLTFKNTVLTHNTTI